MYMIKVMEKQKGNEIILTIYTEPQKIIKSKKEKTKNI